MALEYTSSNTLCTSAPASTRRAPSRSAAGLVVRYWKRPVSVTRPTYSASAIWRRQLHAQPVEHAAPGSRRSRRPCRPPGWRRRSGCCRGGGRCRPRCTAAAAISRVLGAEPALVAAVDGEQRPSLERGRVERPLEAARCRGSCTSCGIGESLVQVACAPACRAGAARPPPRTSTRSHRRPGSRGSRPATRSAAASAATTCSRSCDRRESVMSRRRLRTGAGAACSISSFSRMARSTRLIIPEGQQRSAPEVQLPRDPRLQHPVRTLERAHRRRPRRFWPPSTLTNTVAWSRSAVTPGRAVTVTNPIAGIGQLLHRRPPAPGAAPR